MPRRSGKRRPRHHAHPTAVAAYTTTDPTCTTDRQTVLIGNMRLDPNPDVDAETDAPTALPVDVITPTSARGAVITESTQRRQP